MLNDSKSSHGDGQVSQKKKARMLWKQLIHDLISKTEIMSYLIFTQKL